MLNECVITLVIIMKSNNYQFSFNLGHSFEQKLEENNIFQLLADIFPYLRVKSVTFVVFAFTIITFAIEIYASTIIPQPHASLRNFFLLTFEFCSKNIAFLRLGSEYQLKIGLQYFLTIIIIVQLTDLIIIFLLGSNVPFFIFRNSSLLSIYILSVIDLSTFKEDVIVEFKQQEKPVVQNCDLLDLNDTIVKLKSKENSSFYFESYTNSQFFNHHVQYQDKPKINHKKMMVKTTIKNSNLSNIIQQPFINQLQQSFQTNIYKLILFHFIVFSYYSPSQFLLLIVNQAIIYAVVVTKVIKRLFP